MAQSHSIRDPERAPAGMPEGVIGGALDGALDDAFLDALVGLDRVCRYLAIVLGDAGPAGAPEPDRDLHAAAPGSPGGSDDAPREAWGEPLDALLGLVSVHRTVSLLLAAAGCEPALPAPADAAAWSREVLR